MSAERWRARAHCEATPDAEDTDWTGRWRPRAGALRQAQRWTERAELDRIGGEVWIESEAGTMETVTT